MGLNSAFCANIATVNVTVLFVAAIPIRVKSKIVDTFQIHDRWTEEVALLKTEMSNLLRFYTDQRIPAIQKDILNLEYEINSLGQFDILLVKL